MDEPTTRPSPPERPIVEASRASAGAGASGPSGGGLRDPRALTILTTEHWSLLSARGLVYNEAFARGGMFLSFLSASLVALGLIATAGRFGRDFLVVAAIVLALDLFIGVATLGRIVVASSEDFRCLQGMNRLRHAYHEIVPGLEAYFVTSPHDDVRGVFAAYGTQPTSRPWAPRFLLHGLTTTIGMVAVVDAAIAAVLAAVLLLLAAASGAVAVVGGLVVFAVAQLANFVLMTRGVRGVAGSLRPHFPSPDHFGDDAEEGETAAGSST